VIILLRDKSVIYDVCLSISLIVVSSQTTISKT